MKTLLYFISILCYTSSILSATPPNRAELIPLNSSSWSFKEGTVEFSEQRGRHIMEVKTSFDVVTFKELDFSDGIIECDLKLLDSRFSNIYFRYGDWGMRETFYFRTGRAGKSPSPDAIQYAPVIDGVNLWDLFPQYQTTADFLMDEWTHLKLVIRGKQMQVFINDMEKPVLVVPELMGESSSGTIGFGGQVMVSNLSVWRGLVEELDENSGYDPQEFDPRYIRKWLVTEPLSISAEENMLSKYTQDETLNWQPIYAERFGLVNLTRRFGKSENKRIVWLKTTILSGKEQLKNMRLGFSDEVMVIVNNVPVLVDENWYNTPLMKHPGGRCSIENTSVKIPLKEGENEVLIGVANDFYGWGLIARFDDLEYMTLR